MSSSFPRSSVFKPVLLLVVIVSAAAAYSATPLTVCADPQNPPFSTRAQTGFENQIAKSIASELHRPVRFYWSRMGRGFIREVVNKGACDVLIAVPVGMRGLLVTRPYYRSSYVFVTRTDAPQLSSFDDPKLASMKIGVQILDDDYAPPARALARRRLTKNVVGFEMDNDAGEIISAVANRKVDVAIVWGPLAGFYARRYRNLRLADVKPELDPPLLPFTYEIAVGVRKSELDLYAQINQALQRAQPSIDRILRASNIPTLPMSHVSGERTGQ
jgi:mxaJ protein